MKKDWFKFLPSEIINDILLRLPVRTIAISKCVCKSWLSLLETDEFLKSHHARYRQCLAVLMTESKSSRCRIYELGEEIDADSSHDIHHHNHLTTFDFPQGVAVLGSAKGLLLLQYYDHYSIDDGALYVCNPISREYIKLNCPPLSFKKQLVDSWGYLVANYGFGVSNVSGQYKVVRIMESNNDCQVYTLGTGSWRRVEAAHDLTLSAYGYGTYLDPSANLNGNLHWLVRDLNDITSWISCFDLERECFSTFSLPPLVVGWNDGVFTLRDCLCWCHQTFLENGVTVDICLMKEYGVAKSWTKECVINFNPDVDKYRAKFVRPIKVFKDGDILIECGHDFLYYYSNKMKTTEKYGGPDDRYTRISSELLTPNFLSLRIFKMENVFN